MLYLRKCSVLFNSSGEPVLLFFLFFVCRYSCRWIDDYKDNLQKFFSELKEILPEPTLVVWNLAMPVGERIRGGFLVPQVHCYNPVQYNQTYTFSVFKLAHFLS